MAHEKHEAPVVKLIRKPVKHPVEPGKLNDQLWVGRMFDELTDPGRGLKVPDPRVGIAAQKGRKIAALFGGPYSGSEMGAPGKPVRPSHFVVPEGFVDRLVAGQRPEQFEQPRRAGPRRSNHDDGIGRVTGGNSARSAEKGMLYGLYKVEGSRHI
jgi:hypothetical protein